MWLRKTLIWTVESPRVVVWGLLYLLYVSHLFNILSQHLPSIHGYADDTQIDLSFRPSSIHSDINAVCVSEEYIADVRSWFIANRFND